MIKTHLKNDGKIGWFLGIFFTIKAFLSASKWICIHIPPPLARRRVRGRERSGFPYNIQYSFYIFKYIMILKR